ncbi:MAG: exodeoxyribonuclease VII large subunit [Betaproteobacteria bacterium]|nr:exodeoxyribonuclease VII large subunit [Betaproteobacteria bacterium]
MIDSTRTWSVGALVRAFTDTLSARFNPVEVKGEITNFTRASSGHCYFSLKDDGAQLRCAMFKRSAALVGFDLHDGVMVQARAKVSVYEGRGDLQLVIDSLIPAGEGVWYEKFLQLKRELAGLGLFDEDRKRPIPIMPRTIGVVTSLGAAALHDVVQALRRRVPHIPVVIAAAQVQGPAAPASLIQALHEIQQVPEVDVILMVRGGGSLEDLWAFNDKNLALAVTQSTVPVVSGVGHETDITILDLCADLRATTPTAAAELCAQPLQDIWLQLQQLGESMSDQFRSVLDGHGQTLDWIQSRLGRPSNVVASHRLQMLQLQQRLTQSLGRRMQLQRQGLDRMQDATVRQLQSDWNAKCQRLQQLAWRLHNLDPRLVLKRGYAWLTDEQQKPITSVHQLASQQDLTAHLADGSVGVRVLSPKAG